MYREVLDERKGRCAVASSALQAGSCVLRTSAVCAVSSSSCGWCFTPQVALSRCTGCRKARYCSRKCQQLDWPQHRRECSAWRSIPATNSSPTLLLVCRIAATVFMNSEVDVEVKNRVLKLCHHLDEHSEVKRQKFKEMAQLVLLLLSRYKGDKKEQMKSFDELQIDLEDEILKLFGRVNCNAFSLANDLTNEEVGIGLFPEGALFNHDCDPNCVVSFKGREMLVHVVKDVRKDEELTVSYVELLQSTKKRRSELKGSYFFDCECTRCQASVEKEEDWYLDGLECCNTACGGVVVNTASGAVCKMCCKIRDEEDIARYEREFKAIGALEAKTEQDQWEIYQQKWELATRRLRLHPRNQRVAVMAREIGNFLVGATSVDLRYQALKFLLAELHAVEWVLPKTKLPSRGLLHFQIGKLLYEEINSPLGSFSTANEAEQIQRAAKKLQEALSVLNSAYGSSSGAVTSAQLMLDEVQRRAHQFE